MRNVIPKAQFTDTTNQIDFAELLLNWLHIYMQGIYVCIPLSGSCFRQWQKRLPSRCFKALLLAIRDSQPYMLWCVKQTTAEGSCGAVSTSRREPVPAQERCQGQLSLHVSKLIATAHLRRCKIPGMRCVSVWQDSCKQWFESRNHHNHHHGPGIHTIRPLCMYNRSTQGAYVHAERPWTVCVWVPWAVAANSIL